MTTREEVASAGEKWAARARKVDSGDAAMLRELAANAGPNPEAAKADRLHKWSRSQYASRLKTHFGAHKYCSGVLSTTSRLCRQ